ncbi:MAG: hypothetical protein ACKVP3_28140 [Hyphomicrobiaceae bacterium]
MMPPRTNIENTGASIRKSRLQAPPILIAVLLGLQSTPADACRGYRYWSTGADISKLKAGEVAVTAKLVESYKGEQTIKAIMGTPYGMIYRVQVTQVLGSATGANVPFAADVDIFVRQAASICERYVPRNFTKDIEKVLVLKEGTAGVFELVGGQR